MQKNASQYRTLTDEGAPGPPEASDVRADGGGGPCTVSGGSEVAAIVKSRLDGLTVEKY